jgi:hypothetical protein
MILLVISTCGTSLAGTTNLRGIVVALSPPESGKNERMLTLRGTWGKIPKEGTFRLRVYVDKSHIFLDGKKSTPDEAFKPGHLVRHSGRIAYFDCHSRNHHVPKKPNTLDAANGVYQLLLSGAVDIEYRNVTKGHVDAGPLMADLPLYVECRDGKILSAAVTGFYVKNNTIASLPADTSGLTLVDGRLKGTLTCELLSKRGNGSNSARLFGAGAGRVPCRFEIDAALGTPDTTGTYEGTCGDKPVGGEINGRGIVLPAIGKQYTVWIEITAPVGITDLLEDVSKCWRFSFRRTDQGLVGDAFCPLRGNPNGTVKPVSFELDGNSIHGEATFVSVSKGIENASVRFQGVAVGTFLFGECEVVKSDGTVIKPGRFRGRLVGVDAPSFSGFENYYRKRLATDPDTNLPENTPFTQ